MGPWRTPCLTGKISHTYVRDYVDNIQINKKFILLSSDTYQKSKIILIFYSLSKYYPNISNSIAWILSAAFACEIGHISQCVADEATFRQGS